MPIQFYSLKGFRFNAEVMLYTLLKLKNDFVMSEEQPVIKSVGVDLGALAQPITKLIEVVAQGTGNLYKPVGTVLQAYADKKANIILAEGDEKISAIRQRAAIRLTHIEVERQNNLESIVEKAQAALPEKVTETPVSAHADTQSRLPSPAPKTNPADSASDTTTPLALCLLVFHQASPAHTSPPGAFSPPTTPSHNHSIRLWWGAAARHAVREPSHPLLLWGRGLG